MLFVVFLLPFRKMSVKTTELVFKLPRFCTLLTRYFSYLLGISMTRAIAFYIKYVNFDHLNIWTNIKQESPKHLIRYFMMSSSIWTKLFRCFDFMSNIQANNNDFDISAASKLLMKCLINSTVNLFRHLPCLTFCILGIINFHIQKPNIWIHTLCVLL